MNASTMAAERHPLQNLLDEVDGIVIDVPVNDGYGGRMIHPVELDDEVKNHLRDMLRSAYATGIAKGGRA